MSLRPSVVVLATLVACTGLVGCANGAVDSRPGATMVPTVTDGPSSATSATPSAAPGIDAAVAGATRVTFIAQPEGVDATSLRFDKARNLSEAGEVVRDKMLRDGWFRDASHVQVRSDVVASSDSVLGVTVKGVRTVKGVEETTYSSLWYSTASKQTYSSPALVRPDQWKALGAALATAAKADGRDVTKLPALLAAAAAPYGNAPALSFASDGDLVATFSTGTLAKDAATVELPAEKVTPLLSTFGAHAQQAAMSPSAFTGATKVAVDPLVKPVATRPSTAVGPDCRVVHCVAVTYDDGPSAMTPTLLASLKKAQVPASFFQMGKSIKEYPAIARQVAASGMEVGSHTVTHPPLTTVTPERVKQEVSGNAELIKGFTGASPLLFRPPYGDHNAKVDAIVAEQGQAIMQWEVDTNDWKSHNVNSTIQIASSAKAYKSTIVLEHDVQAASIDAAPSIYANLKAAGVTMVTVSELSLNSGGYQPGHAYCRGRSMPQQGFNCKG